MRWMTYPPLRIGNEIRGELTGCTERQYQTVRGQPFANGGCKRYPAARRGGHDDLDRSREKFLSPARSAPHATILLREGAANRKGSIRACTRASSLRFSKPSGLILLVVGFLGANHFESIAMSGRYPPLASRSEAGLT